MEWRQKTATSWRAANIDGYLATVDQRGAAWHWRIRPPGGGYDLFKGSAATAEGAKADAATQLETFCAELRARPMTPPSK